MKTKILLSVIATLSLSGIALSDSLLPESGDSKAEKIIKEMNQSITLIRQQANDRFDTANNSVDTLRLKQLEQHLQTAEIYKESRTFLTANRELDYANSLLQMPKNEFAIGSL